MQYAVFCYAYRMYISVGSVGLVVSEIRFPNGIEKRLETNALQYLKEEALAFDMQEDEACLAAEEDDGEEDDDVGQNRNYAETMLSEKFSSKYVHIEVNVVNTLQST
jgi:hypothetical protein